ncbi:MAG: autotransporter outer membrane beta-barrel domain-containing protein [Rickettsiales bacterium]|jgi:hypothetical protein|nr:autotransporter outer membrane beta-barrel domain-containing protein [Rickettsiales bacterium]
MRKFLTLAALVCIPELAMANYLNDAGNAWGTIAPGGPTKTGTVATRLRDLGGGSASTYSEIIETIAFNNSALIILETLSHIHDVVEFESDINKTDKMPIVISGKMTNRHSTYNSDVNSEFRTLQNGIVLTAGSFVSDKFQVGLGFSDTRSKNNQTLMDNVGKSYSVSGFAKYAVPEFFVNLSLGIGATGWTDDKLAFGVASIANYDSNFYYADASIGTVFMPTKDFQIIPRIGLNHISITTDRHTDSLNQSFAKWNYSQTAGVAGLEFANNFHVDDFIIRPAVSASGNFILNQRHGDAVHATLINGNFYDIPVDAPADVGYSIGGGIGFIGTKFSANISYAYGSRGEYESHAATLHFTAAF